MNLSEKLETGFSPEALVLIGLIRTEAERLNFPLYIVGGSVRDLILGRAIKDFDLTVEGNSGVLAEFVMKRYGGHIMVHSRFGTATWTLNESTFKRLNVPAFLFSSSSISFDLISARSETYAQPGALPTVKFSSIHDDLQRRDFTINAMALRLDGAHYGELSDPLNGYADLERGLIRVLHPRSFVDDPTRIFRAVRYAVRYGFEIAPETLSLINNEARGVLSGLSGERLRHEFDLMLEEENTLAMLEELDRFAVLKILHPTLHPIHYRSPIDYSLTDKFSDIVLPDILSFHQTLGWIMWLISLPVPDIEAIAKRLAFPSVLTNSASAASKLHLTPYPPGSTNSQKTFYLDAFPALSVYAAWIMASDEIIRQALGTYLLEWRNIKPFTTGTDLKNRCLEPGPKFKEILTRLRAAWLDGEVKSEEEEKIRLDNLLKEEGLL